MNTIELIKVLSENPKTSKNFNGVFPSDCLPKKKLKKPTFVIVNTENRYSQGQHWLGIYLPKKGPGILFDSFAIKNDNRDFIKFLQKNCTSFTYNKKRLQSDFSTTCGQWCCVFIYYKCIGKTLSSFLKLFSNTDYEANDDKIIHLFKKYFKKQKNAPNQKFVFRQSGGKRKLKSTYIQSCCPRVRR